ncbi:fimbria/pilus periplasmic chaperone [Frigidibacter sp. SD6-1]|uniref:fimbrial biogenesis chaperone n=1 Tax=Frigidibacter sp. SD6-1 TaxID=3032581 RepID=UPI0024DF40D7|nr:fimbria/pilus periplasmic chaperone [Frigidibacter sp. SD6-1]
MILRQLCKVATVLAFAASLSGIPTSPVHANTAISPVILDVDASGRASVAITNLRDRPVLYEVTPLSWTIENGKDVYGDTKEFIASPPSFRLLPGQKREIRVGYRGARSQNAEQAFRLRIAEIPSEITDFEGAIAAIAFAHLLPVYVAPRNAVPAPILDWSVRREGDVIIVRATNNGNMRKTVHSLGFQPDPDNGGLPRYRAEELVHVLAGSWREWRIAAPAGTEDGALFVKYLEFESTYQPVRK